MKKFWRMISIIIPTKEEPCIYELVNQINQIIDDCEIIIVDESKITPIFFNKNVRVIKRHNNGLGKSVRKGIERAKWSKIVVMDGDLQHNPKYIPRMIKELDNFQMVIGSRYVNGGEDRRGLFRQIVSKTMTKLVRFKLNNGVRDPLSGYFGFRKEMLNGTKLNCDGFKIGLDIIVKSKTKVKEIPIILEKRRLGKSKAGFVEFLNIMKFMVS